MGFVEKERSSIATQDLVLTQVTYIFHRYPQVTSSSKKVRAPPEDIIVFLDDVICTHCVSVNGTADYFAGLGGYLLRTSGSSCVFRGPVIVLTRVTCDCTRHGDLLRGMSGRTVVLSLKLPLTESDKLTCMHHML